MTNRLYCCKPVKYVANIEKSMRKFLETNHVVGMYQYINHSPFDMVCHQCTIMLGTTAIEAIHSYYSIYNHFQPQIKLFAAAQSFAVSAVT